MMKSDPPSSTFLDILDKCRRGRRRPVIGWIVKLDKQLIAGKKCLVDLIGILNVVDGEVVLERQLVQPDLRCFDERLVNTASFCKRNDSEIRSRELRTRGSGRRNVDKQQDTQPRASNF